MEEKGLSLFEMLILVVGLVLLLIAFSTTVSFEIALLIKQLQEARFDWRYLVGAGLPLVVLIYYSNYRFHKKLFVRRERKRQKDEKMNEQRRKIGEILKEKYYSSSQDLKENIDKINILLDKVERVVREEFGEEIEDWLKEAKTKLISLKHEEDLRDYRYEKENVLREIEQLEQEKKQMMQDERQKKVDLLEKLEIIENNVFVKEKLSEEEIEALESEGYEQANEYDIVDQKILTVLVKPPLKHSNTHAFLVWSARRYLESIGGVSELREHYTIDADITFRFNGKIFALEIETGNLLRKKKQCQEKVNYLNRKYGKRWAFIVSNKNLLSKYRKLGPSTQRSEAVKFLEKLLKLHT